MLLASHVVVVIAVLVVLASAARPTFTQLPSHQGFVGHHPFPAQPKGSNVPQTVSADYWAGWWLRMVGLAGGLAPPREHEAAARPARSLLVMAGGGFAAVAAVVASCLGFQCRKKAARPPAPGGQPITLQPPPKALDAAASASTCTLASHAHLAADDFDDYDQEGLEVQRAEPLSTLSALRTRYAPVEGLDITGVLGQGLWGRTYQASWCGTTVAVKVVDHTVRQARFIQSEKAPALSTMLSHPNVVACYKVVTIHLPSPAASPRAHPHTGEESPLDWGLSSDEELPSWLPTQMAQQVQQARAHLQQGQQVHFLDEQRASDTPPCAEMMSCRDLVRHPSMQLGVHAGQLGSAGTAALPAAPAALTPASQPAPAPVPSFSSTAGMGAAQQGRAGPDRSAGDLPASPFAAATQAVADAIHSSDTAGAPAAADRMRGRAEEAEELSSPTQTAPQAPPTLSSLDSGTVHPCHATADSVGSSHPMPCTAAAGSSSRGTPAVYQGASAARGVGRHRGREAGLRLPGGRGAREGSDDAPLELADPLRPGMYEVWMVQEYCDLGSLGECLKKRKLTRRRDGSHKTKCIFGILMDVAHGMEYLHSKGILHGELRAGNVLLQSNTEEPRGYQAMVAGFGLSGLLDPSQSHLHSGSLVSVGYLAPEVITQGLLGKAADVYAFAMLMYEIWTCERVYPNMTAAQIFQATVNVGLRPPVPADCPGRYASLMQTCWEAEPHNRPPFFILVRELREQLKEIRQHEARHLERMKSAKSVRSLGAAASRMLDM